LIAAGSYLWNSGIFLFKASAYLAELGRHAPDILASCKTAVARAQCSPDFVRLEEDSFRNCPAESIDYAIMEKTDRAAVVPATFGWSDVGSWNALWKISAKDEHENVVEGDVLTADTSGCYVRSEDLLIATLGVKDLVIVETGDAVLIANRDQSQEIKSIVDRLKTARRSEHLNHMRVDRPWGSFKNIESGPGYLVKRLSVRPGAALSLQMHRHRAEHWIVVEGEAEVTVDTRVFRLREHESVDIPRGAKHRLRNPGSAVLEVVEVQTGPHLSEDDIVRFEDVYRRPVSTDL
jgi:mannose-1-phosphate guanylyltransferase/mannose-6-phosphate isomerase